MCNEKSNKFDEVNIYLFKSFKGEVSMTFQDQIFAKGFIDNGVLVGLVRYFKAEGQLMNITNISTSNNIFCNLFFIIIYLPTYFFSYKKIVTSR